MMGSAEDRTSVLPNTEEVTRMAKTDGKKYYHYHYEVQEFGENIQGDICYGSKKDEEKVTSFMRGDLEDTFPDGVVLSFELTAITDSKGKKVK
jgi:hypothetical protein